jgi:KDO2-lipid IV(A) lauroyltransferase
LPDQVPGNGEGEWVPFFGRPAYTMTLIGRLIGSSGATVLMCHSKRLPGGEGYALYFSPLIFDSATSIPQQINAAMEAVISTCPEQYLWSYNRYKVPRGALPPNGHGNSAVPKKESRDARFPHLNPLPQAGEEANESLRESQVNAVKES